MGTTESLLYDDAPIESASIPSGRSRVTATELSSSIPSSNNIRPRGKINKDANLRMNHQQKQQKLSRRRAQSQAKPIKRMEGLVLGGPKTGKRTLLSRLKGVDPFAATEETKSVTTSKSNETKEVKPYIIIQYKPPSESPTWDRIKLRIQYANSIDEGENPVQNENATTAQIDFAVIMISPKDSRETTQSYLEGILTSYLDRLGYRKASGAKNDKEGKERETDSSNHSTGIMVPFCIAILFNFRDLQREQKEDKNSTATRADLEGLVHDTLLSRNVLENELVVELLETSLLNCFGLDGLHRFIYRTYLQRCRTDIERQLEVVRNQIKLTNNNSNTNQADDNNSKAKPMAYDDFLKEISPKKAVHPSQQQVQHGFDSTAKDHQQEQPVPRRINLQSRKQNHKGQTSTLRMGKDALEAFLASSSDDEDAKIPACHGIKFSNTIVNGIASDSDDDSDDDFFYDESGNRRHNINNLNQTITTNGGENRNIALDDHTDDSSSSDNDSEKEAQEVISSPKVSSENPKQMHQQNRKTQTPQQTAMDKEHTANEEKSGEGKKIESTRKETIRQELEVSETSIVEEEEELVDEEDINEKEKHDGTDDNLPHKYEKKDESNHEQILNCDESNYNKAKEADNEADPVALNDVTNNNDNDVEGMNEISCEESNGEVNDEAGLLSSNIDDSTEDESSNNNSAVKSDVDDAVNDENDNNIGIGSTLPFNTDEEDDDDDGYTISSAPVLAKAVQDNEDDDDDYMISSAPDLENLENLVKDDDDDDGYTISSTFAVGKAVVDDDDDDEFMIGNIPANKNCVLKEDDEENGFMIQSNDIEDDDENKTEHRRAKKPSIERSSSGSTVEAEGTESSRNDETLTFQEPPKSPSASKPVSNMPPSKPVASGGISQAALAAIAAAQKDAEAMMREQQQQQYSQIPSSPIKEKKSKKKKKDEKKKKKKKTKGSDD